MGKIEDLLAKQDEGFISLRELLEQMAEEGGDTPQQAARWLQSLFAEYNRTGRGTEPPDWYKRQDVGWAKTSSNPSDDARKTLAKIVETGNPGYIDPKRQWEDMSDDIPF